MGGAEGEAVGAGGVAVALDEGRLVGQTQLVVLLDVVHLVLVGEQDARLRCPAKQSVEIKNI